MEVFVLQTVKITRGSVLRYIVFLAILAAGFCAAVAARDTNVQTIEMKIYFADSEMLRLIPLKENIPVTNAERMAKRVLERLIEGHDENPKIRRFIPNVKGCMSVKVKGHTACVDIKKEMIEGHPEGRDAELLTVYAIVNSLTGIDGIDTVRFTIEGEEKKDFMGHIDMRETFIPDYLV